MHCAAVISGPPDETMRVNVEGTRVLLQAAIEARCERFLYMSTFAVYALDDRAVVDESTPFLQEGPAFQLSRVRAEQAVWAASGSRPPGHGIAGAEYSGRASDLDVVGPARSADPQGRVCSPR